MKDNKVQNNKLLILGKLTASLLHELRNPLSAIKLNVDHLNMMENELPQEANDTVKSSLQAIERMQILIDDLMDFSRKSTNRKTISCINDLTEHAISILHSTANKNKVKIRVNLFKGMPLLLIDKNKLLQVFINLITNAIEACSHSKKDNCSIVVSTFISKDGKLYWQIEDDGVGISKQDTEKIFSDFYTNKKKGTGLGLSVCKSIIEDHESELNFQSVEGKGSKFFIIFNSELKKEFYEAKDSNN